jgi:ribosomal-protein-alanine N-acetyltransferase
MGDDMEMIGTERLVIRRFRREDAADLYEYLSDEDVVRFEPYEAFSMAQCEQEAAQRAEDPSYWAVYLRDGGKLIGNIWFCQTGPEFDTWELGYVFNAKYQHRGYATEACRAVLDRAFGAMNARRVVAMCDPLNAPSWRLLERLGFRREGHKLQTVFFRRDAQGNPIWKDTYEYAMLKNEWKS